MSVKIDSSGHRWVQAEAEVPGNPEEVWRAIATGPGISSWFVPTQLEERVGGRAVSSFGPGMDSQATVVAWQPPHRFVAENREDLGPGSPTIITEWKVEPLSAGMCRVTVRHSWKTESSDWDAQYEQVEIGWREAFFRILRLYLTHFRGQTCAAFQLMATSRDAQSQAWLALTRPLGLEGVATAQRVRSPAGAPLLAGIVEQSGPEQWPAILLRLDEPAPGIAHLFAMPMGDQIILSVRFFFYGDRAAETARAAEEQWQRWVSERFPRAV